MNPLILKNNLLFTGRGTTALYLLFRVIEPDIRKVLLPVNICEVVVAIVRHSGLEPVFYDVERISGNGGLEQIQEKWTNEEILLVTHNFGQPVMVDEIVTWAESKNIFVIEDVCNAFGASYNGRMVGEYGHAAIYSFGYAKIVENGIGGAVSVKDGELFDELKKLNETLPYWDSGFTTQAEEFANELSQIRSMAHILPESYCKLYETYSTLFLHRLTKTDVLDIKKAIVQLGKNIEDRRFKSDLYRKHINNDMITHRPRKPGEIIWRYTCLCKNEKFRNGLIKDLRSKNLLVSAWYPRVDNLFGYRQGEFPGGEFFGKHVINFFVDHRVTVSDIDKTVNAVNEFRNL